MLIASLKPGHDGTIAVIDDGRVICSFEAEKDSFPRYDRLGPSHFLDFMKVTDRIPDVFCISGWPKGAHSVERGVGHGYFGTGPDSHSFEAARMFGKDVKLFSSTHERSHVYCAVGMSPFGGRTDCHCLVWEGNIGRFYRVSRGGVISPYASVMADPGNKYAFLYSVADTSSAPPSGRGVLRLEDAGKLMALCAYGEPGEPTAEERTVIDWLISIDDGVILNHAIEELKDTRYYKAGVLDPAFCQLARRFSDAVFEKFHAFAAEHLEPGLPLVIAGGCGLNCDWNHKWRQSPLFTDLFVPPCPNDSGSALGTAIEAQALLTGRLSVDWSVYAGQQFIIDADSRMLGLTEQAVDVEAVARDLMEGHVVAVAHGACEIGPRALGNRSLLAAPFSAATKERLNGIKKREGFRPIAPVALESDYASNFEGHCPSPYMLEFAMVTNDSLQAITHVDGSARPQTVNRQQNPLIFDILTAFKRLSGVGVLCNTSLNFNGRGFINRLTDLAEYCEATGIERMVAGDRYLKAGAVTPASVGSSAARTLSTTDAVA
jgi:hydroxymethyl cephem carbamoyltransferase